VSNERSEFVRALESEYEVQVAGARASGLDEQAAHERAFEAIKEMGDAALDELRRAAVDPFTDVLHQQGGRVRRVPPCAAARPVPAAQLEPGGTT